MKAFFASLSREYVICKHWSLISAVYQLLLNEATKHIPSCKRPWLRFLSLWDTLCEDFFQKIAPDRYIVYLCTSLWMWDLADLPPAEQLSFLVFLCFLSFIFYFYRYLYLPIWIKLSINHRIIEYPELEGTRKKKLVKQDLPLRSPCWLCPMSALPFRCFLITPSTILPGTEVSLLGL